jgi:hypothetical protein
MLETDSASSKQYSNMLGNLESRANEALVTVKLSGEFDKNPAIVQISAGVGGTDAQDWGSNVTGNVY